MLKKITVMVMSLSLVAIPAVAETQIGEQFKISGPTFSEPGIGVVIEDSQKIKNHYTMLQSWGANAQGLPIKVSDMTWCKEYGQKNCGAGDSMLYKTALGFCNSTVSYDCVQSVVLKDKNGVSHEATFVRDFPGSQKYSYVGSSAVDLPNGGTNFLVQIKDAPHSKGDLYLVAANIVGSRYGSQEKFSINDFTVGVFAVSIVQGSYLTPRPIVEDNPNGTTKVGTMEDVRVSFDRSTNEISSCAQVSTTECALPWPLPLDSSISLKLKMRTKVTGWLHGRLSDINAEITSSSDGDQLLTVTGKPVVVPTVFTWFKKSEMPKSIENFYKNLPNWEKSGTGFGAGGWEGMPTSILKDYIGYTVFDFPEAIAWFDAIGDKAPMTSTQWSFRTMENGSLDQKCYNKDASLVGMVSTNSTMFVANPPEFNKVDQTLDYKVSSPHFLPDGSVFKGSYNLAIKGDFARCIYGYSSAPVSATVSILSADGTSQVATTTLKERSGWLYLSANGFTFSAPTLKVKLTQEKVVEKVSAPSAKSTQQVGVKKTITCIKGKTTKKVTSANPMCPTGYKKK